MGNKPLLDDKATKSLNEAPKGSAPPKSPKAGNAFKFTVDTSSPVISGGKTGLSLKNAGVTTGDEEMPGKSRSAIIRSGCESSSTWA